MDIETGIVIAFSIRQPAAGFSRLDRDELESWASSGRRVEYEDAWDAANQFALIYRGGEPWSSWAVTRESTEILVWDCVTHHDLGRFATMRDALAALTAAPAVPMPATNVISFRRIATAA